MHAELGRRQKVGSSVCDDLSRLARMGALGAHQSGVDLPFILPSLPSTRL